MGAVISFQPGDDSPANDMAWTVKFRPSGDEEPDVEDAEDTELPQPSWDRDSNAALG